MVPFNNLQDWNRHITTFCDLKVLGIEYVFHHGFNNTSRHTMTHKIREQLRTTSVPLSKKGKPLEPGVHHGVPKKGSSSIWILSTWQTWRKYIEKNYQITREYVRTVQKKKSLMQTYAELHAGFWVVDESHFVKNIGKGSWKFPELMKTQQPDLRSWVLAMFGTMISSDSTDIQVSVSAMSFDSLNKSDHPLHELRPEGLNQAKRAMMKHINAPGVNTKKEADQAVQTFRHLVVNILIRRHDGSRWEGERLIDLPALYSRRVAFVFPVKYIAVYGDMVNT